MSIKNFILGRSWIPRSSRGTWVFCSIFLFSLTLTARAVQAIYPFEQSEQKARFEQLLKSYRCVVCENQTLAESETTLARDLRQLVYDKVKAGESDEQIDGYLQDRYGQFIQYRPAFMLSTLLLWLAPLGLLLLGLFFVWRQSRS